MANRVQRPGRAQAADRDGRQVTPEMIASDAAAFFDFLAARPEVKGDAFGVCGYCMGGRTSVIVAGRVPERVAAAMSFHGGGLVTDDPSSPHLLADQMDAAVYVGRRRERRGRSPPRTAETLDKALTAAGVEHTVEFYPAAHGFAVPDNAPYDEAAAERHWTRWRSCSPHCPDQGWTRCLLERSRCATMNAVDDQVSAPMSRRASGRGSTPYSPAVGCWSTARSTSVSRPPAIPAPTSSSSTSRTRSRRRTRRRPATT